MIYTPDNQTVANNCQGQNMMYEGNSQCNFSSNQPTWNGNHQMFGEQTMVPQPGYNNGVENMPNAHSKVTSWQNNYCSNDSGIASGSLTPASDHNSEWSSGTYCNPQVVESSYLSSDSGIGSVQPTPPSSEYDSSLNVTPVSEAYPGQQNDQNPAEILYAVASTLIQNLYDNDAVIVTKAATFISHLCEKYGLRNVLLNHPQMIPALLRTIYFSDVPDIITTITKTLSHLSSHVEGSVALFKNCTIVAVLRLVNCNVEIIKHYAATILHNILMYNKDAMMVVIAQDGLQKLTALLNDNNPAFLSIVADCIRRTCFLNADAKSIFLDCQGPQALVRILKIHKRDSLLCTVVRILKILSTCSANKKSIIEAGGMNALGRHLSFAQSGLVMNCLSALRNLSDCANKLTNIGPLIKRIMELLVSSTDRHVLSCCTAILANITCQNEHNKKLVCRMGGIESLVMLIVKCGDNQGGDNDEIILSSVCALRHLISGKIISDRSANSDQTFRDANGIATVVNLVAQNYTWSVTEEAIRLIKNLAIHSRNHAPLREAGAIQKLAYYLMSVFHNVKKDNCPTMRDITPNQQLMYQQMEWCLVGLRYLAQDFKNRRKMIELNLIPVMSQLCYVNVAVIKRLADGLIREFMTN